MPGPVGKDPGFTQGIIARFSLVGGSRLEVSIIEARGMLGSRATRMV